MAKLNATLIISMYFFLHMDKFDSLKKNSCINGKESRKLLIHSKN
jgi:hypothetical protein